MKKIILVLLISSLAMQTIQAQLQQQKVLLLQIAALQTYIGFAQKGYGVVKKGLNFIGDLKKGELNLHQDYFSSLKKVNPKIKNYVKVAEIVSIQLAIIKESKKTFAESQHNDLFYGDELDYIQRSFDRLLENCNATLNQLLQLTKDTSLEMKDDQRMERIDGLRSTMLDDYEFCKSFCDDIRKRAMSRAKERNDVKVGQVLNGL